MIKTYFTTHEEELADMKELWQRHACRALFSATVVYGPFNTLLFFPQLFQDT